jgi:hypothetical protein
LMRIYFHYDVNVKANEPVSFLPLVTLKPMNPISLQISPRKK